MRNAVTQLGTDLEEIQCEAVAGKQLYGKEDQKRDGLVEWAFAQLERVFVGNEQARFVIERTHKAWRRADADADSQVELTAKEIVTLSLSGQRHLRMIVGQKETASMALEAA